MHCNYFSQMNVLDVASTIEIEQYNFTTMFEFCFISLNNQFKRLSRSLRESRTLSQEGSQHYETQFTLKRRLLIEQWGE